MTTARTKEADILIACVSVARGFRYVDLNEITANVIAISAPLVKRKFPTYAENMLAASNSYFAGQSGSKVTTKEILDNRWIISLPRLKNMLEQRLAAIGAQ